MGAIIIAAVIIYYLHRKGVKIPLWNVFLLFFLLGSNVDKK